MRISVGKFGFSASVAVLALGLGSTAVAQAAPDATAAGGQQLEEITVTATKREEKLKDVPVAVSVINAAQLQNQHITDIEDAIRNVSSIAFSTTGGEGQDNISIRGISSNVGSQVVGIYLDDVPLLVTNSYEGVTIPKFLDMARIEVLKGPQGTLFGRNTTGGAILLQTKKPTNEFEGYAQIQLGNYNDREFEGAVNIPIVRDKVLLRVSANIAQRDGFTHVLNTPQGPKDLDSRDFWAGRVQITLRPSDDFENDILAYSNYKHETGTSAFLVAANPAILTANGGSAFAAQAASIIAQQNALGPRTSLGLSVNNSLDKDWTFGVLNTTRWDISDNLTLKNIASFIQRKQTNNHDLDGSSGSGCR
jgi:iron complex outermembrane receptor protein